MAVPDWRQIPSLSALRAFEATARLGGFSAAARVLNVTHAAIAQQVRGLEAELGVTLVQREGRGIGLTAPGAQLAAALGDGFASIAEGVAALRNGERARGLRVSSTTTFAHAILVPRIAEFWADHPDIPVSVSADQRLVDLAREGYDVAIRSGDGGWPGVEAEFLAHNQFLLCGAPSLLDSQPDLTRLPWLLTPTFPVEFGWLRAAGYDPDALNVIDMDGALACKAAVNGYGLVFATDAVVREDIAAGRLRTVPFAGLPRMSYYAVTPKGPRRPAVQAFIDWLKSLVRK
jgi:LysR family glycine cleavage system transcriptional activator